MAANAVRNADLHRALQIIEDLRRDLTGGRNSQAVVVSRHGRPKPDR